MPDDSDFLNGATAIGNFLNVAPRRAYYILERGLVPAAKIGNVWTARKSRLIEHHEKREAETLTRATEAFGETA